MAHDPLPLVGVERPINRCAYYCSMELLRKFAFSCCFWSLLLGAQSQDELGQVAAQVKANDTRLGRKAHPQENTPHTRT